jgi:hypothetical protein
MPSHVCIDCESPGDGNCSACGGTGRSAGVNFSSGEGGDVFCSSCGGSGLCAKCEGSGEIEIGGES